MRVFAALLLVLASFSAAAETRVYAGPFATHWKTSGDHGHDQPCLFAPDCEADDLVRANLDNSIGFRAGVERTRGDWRALRLVAGADASFTDTEYNISQRNLNVFAAAVAGGVDADLWRVQLGARLGGGPFVTSDLTAGAQAYGELALTVPLVRAAALRMSVRETVMKPLHDGDLDLDHSSDPDASLRSRDVSILFVSTSRSTDATPWTFSAASGISSPRDLELSNALFTRLSVQRAMTPAIEGAFSWTSSAHESEVEGVFMGFGGNYRSKTVEAYGLSVRATHALSSRWSAFANGGAEAADWSDDHGLLIGEAGEVLDGGFELGVSIGGGVRRALTDDLAVEAFVEHVWWPGLDLGEIRSGVGIVIR
ncbi:MAG TPA: hypothetical protein VF911_13020 [Thermoanaerobaculia bacterium]